MDYCKRLKDIREDRDFTQAQIATVLETTRQQVSKWETGVQMMGVDKYVKLAKFYNLSVDYLLGIIDEPKELR